MSTGREDHSKGEIVKLKTGIVSMSIVTVGVLGIWYCRNHAYDCATSTRLQSTTMSRSVDPPMWFGSPNLEYVKRQKEVLSSIVYTGKMTIANFAIDEKSKSGMWECITNITHEGQAEIDTYGFVWHCAPEYDRTATNGMPISPEQCITKVLKDLANAPTNEWQIRGVGGEVTINNERKVTNAYVVTWQHYITARSVILNDLVNIGVGPEGYLYVTVTETPCRKVGSIEIDVLSINENFVGAKPGIEQHYLVSDGEVKPVWVVSVGQLPIVIDCVTKSLIKTVGNPQGRP